MAASKKKKVTQKENPGKRRVEQSQNPNHFYTEKPAWNFSTCDEVKWQLNEECAGELFWKEVLPYLKEQERKTWNTILISEKTKNHTIDVRTLHKDAQRRLTEMFIEVEGIISLRINGTHRLYGYTTGRVFNILWFDTNHGDNSDCICRSYLKHT